MTDPITRGQSTLDELAAKHLERTQRLNGADTLNEPFNGSGIDGRDAGPSILSPPPDLPEPPLSAYAEDFAMLDGEPADTPPTKQPYATPIKTFASDPRDLAGKLYEGQPFDIRWLPAALGDFAIDTAERMGGDAGAVVMGQFLACCSCADDGFYTLPKLQDIGWRERACIWTLATGASATSKTWLYEAALRQVQVIDGEITDKYAIDFEAFQDIEERYQEQRAKAVKNGTPKPEREREKPIQEHILLNEFTLESLRPALLDSRRGIGIYRDEFAGTLKDLDRYSSKGGGDRYSLMELHNGGTKKIGRVGNFVTVKNWSASVGGCLTPDSLRASMKDMHEDGLLQRFMICMVTSPIQDVDRAPDHAAAAAYETILRTLREQRAGTGGHPIPFSPDAYAVRMDFMQTMNALAQAENIPGAMASHIRKWRGLFPRLCLLFHLVDLAVQGRHPNLNEQISGKTAEKVRDVLTWQHTHLEEFWLETMAQSHGSSFAQRIASHILAHGVRAFSHNKHIAEPYYESWKALKPADQQAVYATLENAGWLERDPSAKLNVDKVWSKWTVNERVHTKFIDQAEQDRERRAQFRARNEERKAALSQIQHLPQNEATHDD